MYDASRQWAIDHDDRPPCAWCFGPGTQGNSFGSHGICQRHAEKLLASLKQGVASGTLTE